MEWEKKSWRIRVSCIWCCTNMDHLCQRTIESPPFTQTSFSTGRFLICKVKKWAGSFKNECSKLYIRVEGKSFNRFFTFISPPFWTLAFEPLGRKFPHKPAGTHRPHLLPRQFEIHDKNLISRLTWCRLFRGAATGGSISLLLSWFWLLVLFELRWLFRALGWFDRPWFLDRALKSSVNLVSSYLWSKLPVAGTFSTALIGWFGKVVDYSGSLIPLLPIPTKSSSNRPIDRNYSWRYIDTGHFFLVLFGCSHVLSEGANSDENVECRPNPVTVPTRSRLHLRLRGEFQYLMPKISFQTVNTRVLANKPNTNKS